MKLKLLTAILLLMNNIYAQNIPEIICQVKTTSVKNQNSTGTCWAFATTSFIETEMLRNGKEPINLSEMFFVRNAYMQKAWNFYLMNGKNNFSQGGQAHDVLNVVSSFGILPENIYSGLKKNDSTHNHTQLEELLKKAVEKAVKEGKSNNGTWKVDVEAILNANLGSVPKDFEWNGKKYTSQSFAKEIVGLNPADYVELTSFTHRPYYKSFSLEVSDNWSHDLYYNLPLDELIQVMENSLKEGYSVDWDGDVSEDEFEPYNGVVWYPENEMSSAKKEIEISVEMRQNDFENLKTTDDHLMHITGLAKDKYGIKYFLTKNSWGKEGKYNGYLYLSEAYVRLKTIAIMVHRNAIPEKIRKKISF